MIEVAKRAEDFLARVLVDESTPSGLKDYIAEKLDPDLSATPRETSLRQAIDVFTDPRQPGAARRAAIDTVIAFAKGET